MITIYPTAESGLDPSAYKIKLPGSFISIQPKKFQLNMSLNGNPILSMYEKSNIGTVNTVDMLLTYEQYNQLDMLVNVDDYFLVITSGKKYKAMIDITAAEESKFNNAPRIKCTVQFIVVEVIA